MVIDLLARLTKYPPVLDATRDEARVTVVGVGQVLKVVAAALAVDVSARVESAVLILFAVQGGTRAATTLVKVEHG
jgi:hypothetical protein